MKLNAENTTLTAATFTVQQPDGFFVPYGDYPHKMGLQRFDRASAETMAGNYEGILNKLANMVAGPAVYIGHPDVPGRAAEFTDKKAYGRITAIEPAENGCFFRAKMNEDGVKLIANSSFAYYSPYWGCERVAGGIRPVKLYSMGLTNEPNIDVPALANERETEPENQPEENTIMQQKIIAALVAAGLIQEGASEEDILKALEALKKPEPEKKEEEPAPEKAEEEIKEDPAKEEEKEIEEKTENSQKQIEVLRLALINTHITRAVEEGKLTAANEAEQRAALIAVENADDLKAACEKMHSAAPVLKTVAATKDLAKEAKKVSAANDQAAHASARQELVEKCKAKFPNLTGNDLLNAAWAAARQAKPEIF